jgi:uncharacterized protein
VSGETRRRRPAAQLVRPEAEAAPTPPGEATPPPKPREKRPFLLDFFPLETPDQTRLSRFFERLKEGKVSTTRCPKDDLLLWPPRTACPVCHSETLEWVDLPPRGRLYAFSAILGGAPLGMEDEVPFAVGLVDLEGAPLRLFGRIEGRPWTELHIGQPVRFEPYEIGDGRWFYRFRTET